VRDSEGVCHFFYGNRARSTYDFTLVKDAILTDDADEILPLGDDGSADTYCAVLQTQSGTVPGWLLRDRFYSVIDGQPYIQALYQHDSSITYVGPRKKPLNLSADEVQAYVRQNV
jgi:hypothetical protein